MPETNNLASVRSGPEHIRDRHFQDGMPKLSFELPQRDQHEPPFAEAFVRDR